MRRFAYVCAALAALSVVTPARSQSVLPFTIEGRGGLAFPTGDFGEGLGLGYGLAAHVGFNLTPMIGAYAGYGYTQFDYDEDIAGDETFNVQGFEGGARLSLPAAGFSPYLRGGVVYYKGGVSDGPSSDNELGFQVGGGLDYPLGPVVSITPEVSYVTVPAEFGPDASFIRVDFGLRMRL